MSRLTALQTSILRLEESRRAESDYLLKHPEDDVAAVILLNSERAIKRLRADLLRLTEAEGIGIMNYALSKRSDRLHASAVGASLFHFQRTLNVAAESVAVGAPVARMEFSESTRGMALEWGHEMELEDGTRSFLFLADRRSDLFKTDSTLDRAVGIVEELSHADNERTINRIANEVGKPAVAALDDWAKANMSAGCAVTVDWLPRKMHIDPVEPPQWHALHSIIHATERQESVEVKVEGTLVGLHLEKERFWLETDDDEVIKGKFSPGLFGDKAQAKLPAGYKCHLLKKTKINKSTDKVSTEWILLDAKKA